MKQKPPYPIDQLPAVLKAIDDQIEDFEPQEQLAFMLDLAVAILVDSMLDSKEPEKLLLAFHKKAGSTYKKFRQAQPKLRIVH